MPEPFTQLEALQALVEALEADGRLTDEHVALIAMAGGLAGAVDEDPLNAALWREYRAAVGALSEAGADGDDDDGQEFVFRVQTPGRAKVGDPKKS